MTKLNRCTMLLLALTMLFALSARAELKFSDTDYRDQAHWLRYDEAGDKPFDVFAVYPTVTFSEDEADIPFVRLDSEMMRAAATGWLMENGQLLEAGNVYAPLYRQLNGAMLNTLDSAGFEGYTTSTPQEDIYAAFDYFLKEINKGERPFLLFGHSQGAQLVGNVATTLLADAAYREHNENHIATYAIGYPVLASDIAKNPALAFASGATDAGVLLTWNTVAPSEIGTGAYRAFGTWKEGALVFNPISWTAEELLAHAKDNPVSFVPGEGGALVEQARCVNALADREHSVLVVTSLDESRFDGGLTTVSKYHRYDVAFYFESIRQNILDRTQAFLAADALDEAA